MPKREAYDPPPDPDFAKLARDGYAAWKRDQPYVVAFDTETTGLAHFDTAFCVTVAWRRPKPRMEYIGTGPGPKNVMCDYGGKPVVRTYRDFKQDKGGIEAHYFELADNAARAYVKEILATAATLVGHHIKFDLQKLLLAGLYEAPLHSRLIEDTEVLAHLLDEHRPKGLKDLAVSVLGYDDIIEVPYVSGPKAAAGETRKVAREKYEIDRARMWAKREYGLASVKEVGYHLLPRGVVVPYAIKDALWTLQLWERFRPQLAGHADLLDLYEQEMELTLVLLEMEHRGMKVRREYVQEQIREYTNRLIRHDIAIQQVVGKPVGKDTKNGEFNPASNDCIREFFTAAGFDREKYDRKSLDTIDHPLAPLINQRRKDDKLLGTYFKAIRDEERDGVLHPSYRQNVSTGRMSSGKETDGA